MFHPDVVFIIYNSAVHGYLTEHSSFADEDCVIWTPSIHHFEEYKSMIAIMVTLMYGDPINAISQAKKQNEPDTYVLRYEPDPRRVDFSFPLWYYDDEQGDSDG